MNNSKISTSILSPLVVIVTLNTWCTTRNYSYYDNLKLLNKQKVEKILDNDVIVYELDIDKNIINTNENTTNTNNNYINKSIDLDSLKLNNSKEYIRSVEISWSNEVDFFVQNFNIRTSLDFENKVKGIQEEFNLWIDWVIWPNTLKIIYLNYYILNSNLPIDIQNRLDIYNDMEKYPNNPRLNSSFWKLNPSNVPNIFSKNYYLWIYKWENIVWTYINKNLIKYILENINSTKNIAYVSKIEWKYFLAVYVSWKLELLTYISPWRDDIPWWMKTTKWTFSSNYKNKYYISWAKDSVSRWYDWNYYWAIMPYAINIIWWIYAHAWIVNWEEMSHGCIRSPIYYAKWLYDIYSKTWKLDWIILEN